MKMKELVLMLSIAGALPVLAAITPATLINDNMVLQRDKAVPIGEADLIEKMRARVAAGAACVVARNGVIEIVREGRGVRPALNILDAEGGRLAGAVVVDKIVGRAAASVWIVAGVRKVVAEVMSEGAVKLLEAHGVAHAAERIVPTIRNRAGTGECPMELRAKDQTDPAEIVRALRR